LQRYYFGTTKRELEEGISCNTGIVERKITKQENVEDFAFVVAKIMCWYYKKRF